MKRFALWSMVAMAALVAAVAYAGEKVDPLGSKYPFFIDNGLYIGKAGVDDPTDNKINKIRAILTCTPTIDIGAAGAAATVVATGSCPGLALGDVVLPPAPSADSAAWDEGPLTAFAESANTVKLVYHADATGGDPASMVYYITFIKRSQ